MAATRVVTTMREQAMREQPGEDGLFEEPPRVLLTAGMQVRVQTVWGSEVCVVQDVGRVDGFPMVTLRGSSGDVFSISVARVSTDVDNEERGSEE